MVRELNWNFEEWFEHNKKLMQEFKERMFNKDNEIEEARWTIKMNLI